MKTVAVDFRISEKSENKLKELGFKVIKTFKNPDVYEAICGHPDIVMCKIDVNTVIAEKSVCKLFRNTGITVIEGVSRLKKTYPYDISYNCVRVGEFLICKAENTDAKILDYCKNNGIKILNTRQGYAKCSVCVVSDNAIITSDENICELAQKNNIDVLFTSNEGIILEGFDYGFIGGTSGLIGKNLLAFNGDIKLHKDGMKIVDFCRKHNVDVVSLSDEKLTDIGSIIVL